jgi:hypothetical protein
VLSHFCIYKGRIQGGNGRVTIDAPCAELDFEAVIPADRFLKAVDACDGEPQLRFTDKGKLVVERKPFRAMLPTQKFDSFPRAIPSGGDRYKVGDGLIDSLKLLRPFIATDAERAWASTMLFDEEGNVYSSTNAMIAMTHCDAFVGGLGQVQLPVFAVDELIRLAAHPNGYPDMVASDASGITFFYDEAWVKAAHIAAEWPSETAKDWLNKTAEMKVIPKGLMSSIEQLLPFCPDPKFPVIHFRGGALSTAEGDTSATIDGFDLGEASIHADNIRPMLSCADKMGLVERAAIFTGDDFKGVLALLRI